MTGEIVWHDLLTHDAGAAKRFYADFLGWDYQFEQAAHFAWSGGEASYPLIIRNGEAQGGILDVDLGLSSRWLPYVAVSNVDKAVARASDQGGQIIRQAFDIPGVGRTAVVRDPAGGVICPFHPSHTYPPPRGTFVSDTCFSADAQTTEGFYNRVFDWPARIIPVRPCPAGNENIIGWFPSLAVADIVGKVEQARGLGATLIVPSDFQEGCRTAVLRDPVGAVFGLIEP
ncbi:MAG: VOC family protein [Sneathiella sp.]